MTRLAALALALAATPASAATLTPWEPGASPCAGACSLEWARAQTGAPAGELVPLTIPAETPVLWMSYARDGVPYGIQYHGRPTLRPLAAVGYPLGDGRWLVQVEECGNMAIIWMPSGALSALLTEAGATEIAAPPPASTPPGSTPPLPPVVVTVPPIVPPVEPPGVDPDPEPPVTPVPLPLPLALLAAALGVLGLMRRMRG